MIRNYFRRRTYIIGAVVICVCIFRFSTFTNVSSPKINNLQLSTADLVSSSTATAGSLLNNVTRQHRPNKFDKKHDKHVSYPWRDDPVCKQFTVQVSSRFRFIGTPVWDLFLQHHAYFFKCLKQQLADRDSLPKWALTSFPGSGVTWTRQMIEGITGIYTGSVHELDPSPVQVEGNVYHVSLYLLKRTEDVYFISVIKQWIL